MHMVFMTIPFNVLHYDSVYKEKQYLEDLVLSTLIFGVEYTYQ